MPGTTAVTNNGSDVSFGKDHRLQGSKIIYKISEKGIIGEHPEWSLSTGGAFLCKSKRKQRKKRV